MENNSFQEIYEKLKNSKKVLLSLHKGPDGDSLSSCVSMKYFLEKSFGCEVKIISKDPLDEVLGKLEISKEIEFGVDINEVDFGEFDIFVALDSGSLDMINFDRENQNKIFIINLDHHSTNSFYGNLNYVDSNRNSCASILIDFFRETKVNFDSELSTRLILGVCTDSGFFKNMGAENALKDVVFLIENDAKYAEFIVKEIISEEPLRLKKYGAYMILNFILNKEKRYGYSLLPYEKIKEFNLSLSEVRQGISHIKVSDVDFVFTISELEEGVCKVSFRSLGDFDVSKFAKELGGGGHKPAASAELKGISLEEAKEKVLGLVENL